MNVPEKLHRGIKIIPAIAGVFLFFLCISSFTASAQRPGEGANIMPPPWAPYYDNVSMVRYYYFPDIECYYDVWNHEFVYLEDGSWMFGATLPPAFAWFDLNNAFVVVLNSNVFEPWMHFHYYVSHYPRYYYRTTYRDTYNDVNRPMRGFNENVKAAVYNNSRVPNVENRAAIPGNQRGNQPIIQPGNQPGNQSGNNMNTRNEARQNAGAGNNLPSRTVAPTHPSQRMQYYGKDIGRPVKVQKNMRSQGGSQRR